MRALLALATAVTPAVALGVWSTLPGIADNATFNLAELPPLPALDAADVASSVKEDTVVDQLWLKVVASTKLTRFADLLQLDAETLARLNKV